MVFVNETWEISPTPIFSFLVNMRPSSILLKRPVVVEHVVSKFEYHWKYLLYVPLMINCFLLEGDTTLEYAPSQTITFLGNFCICLMPPFVSDLAPRSSHLRSYKLIQCRTFFRQKTKISKCPL